MAGVHRGPSGRIRRSVAWGPRPRQMLQPLARRSPRAVWPSSARAPSHRGRAGRAHAGASRSLRPVPVASRARAALRLDAPAPRQEPGHAGPADGGARSARPHWAPAPLSEPRLVGVRSRRVPALGWEVVPASRPVAPVRGRGLAALAGACQCARGQGQGPPPAPRHARGVLCPRGCRGRSQGLQAAAMARRWASAVAVPVEKPADATDLGRKSVQ
jgi:hypothetical protein